MSDVVQTYLGWDQPRHLPGCTGPAWQVDTREEYDRMRPLRTGRGHECAAEECDHRSTYTRTTLRLVCRSCGVAYVLKSEDSLQRFSTYQLGFGQAPQRKSGVWLWPGEPLLKWEPDEPPYQYLVTRERVARVERADVIGLIGRGRGQRGGTVWYARAVQAGPDSPGRYGCGLIRWEQGQDGLKTLAAAAKWIAAEGGAA